jgi:hypothetical protein
LNLFKRTYLILIILTGCVELYEFRIENENPSLVIEGQISDLSYKEYMAIPADGRFFKVRLSLTSNVVNERNQPVKNAFVTLLDSEGNIWPYQASEVNPGMYFLYDVDFKALPGIGYKLRVELQEGGLFESDWETLPENRSGHMGEIGFEEVIRQQYVYKSGEQVLDNVRGIDVNIELPVVSGKGPVYYRWDFDATWIFRATLVSVTSPTYRCWVTDPYYLSDYVVHEDNTGGYEQVLFFFPVESNDRIFDRISYLVSQYTLSEQYYNYLAEIQEQDQRKGLFDPPPYNLLTNLHAEDPEQAVYGYFSVVGEQGKRWYFDRTDLEYPIPNTWREFCTNPNILPDAKPQCYSCLNYGDGFPSTEEPWWWKE